MKTFIYLSVTPPPGPVQQPDALAFPFLIKDDVNAGTYYFGLLVCRTNAAGASVNGLLHALLLELNWDTTNQPSSLSGFLTAVRGPGAAAETWVMYAASSTTGPIQPFIDGTATKLASFLSYTVNGIPGEVVIPQTITVLPAAESMEGQFLTSATLSSWSTFDSQRARFHLKLSGSANCVPGFVLTFNTANDKTGGAVYQLPPTTFDISFEAASGVGEVRVGGVPVVGDILDLGDNKRSLKLLQGVPDWRIQFQWRFSDQLKVSFKFNNALQLNLQSTSATPTLYYIAEEDKESRSRKAFVNVDAGQPFTFEASFPLIASLFQAAAPPVGRAEPIDYKVLYQAKKTTSAPHPQRSLTFARDAVDTDSDPPLNLSSVASLGTVGAPRALLNLVGFGSENPAWASPAVLLDGAQTRLSTQAGLSLVGFETPLQAILGEDAKNIGQFKFPLQDLNRGSLGGAWFDQQLRLFDLMLPLLMTFEVPPLGGQDDWTSITLLLALHISLEKMELLSEEIPFFFVKTPNQDFEPDRGCLDLQLFALEHPLIADADDLPSAMDVEDNHHGMFSLPRHRLTFDMKGYDVDPAHPENQLTVWLPGGPIGNIPEENDVASWKARRFSLDLQKFNPRKPASDPLDPDDPDCLVLRLDPNGATFFGNLRSGQTVHLIKDENTYFHGGVSVDTRNSKPGQPDVEAHLKVIENSIDGLVFARGLVPGFDNLYALLEASIAKSGHGGPPKLDVKLTVDSSDSHPTGSLAIGYFNLAISEPHLELGWNSTTHKWEIAATCNGLLTFRGDVTLVDGLSTSDSIQVNHIDLLTLHHQSISVEDQVSLNVPRFHLSLFGDMIALSLDDLSLSWNNNVVTGFTRHAAIDFGTHGHLRGGVSAGNIQFEAKKGSFRISRINAIGFSLDVPGSFGFSGNVSWHDADDSARRGFAISGEFEAPGFPTITGSLVYGRVIKEDGSSAPAVAVYAGGSPDQILTTNLVLKEVDLGVGWNRQLGDLPPSPNVDQVLQVIDTLEPGNVDNWHVVTANGDRLSIVVRAVFGSTIGGSQAPSAYIATLLLVFNEGGTPFAAGKIWFLSSSGFAARNLDRPSLIGAVTLNPRQHALTASLRTSPHGAIEFMPQLEAILENVEAELDLRITPALVDIHLKRLTYSQSFLGTSFNFSGEWRLATYRETVLQYVHANANGHIGMDLHDGPGGFSFDVDLNALLEYGGIVGRLGLKAYGEMGIDIHASCSAYVDVAFKTKIIKCKWKSRGPDCWDDWLEYSKRFSATVSATLRLAGAFAFQGDLHNGAVSAGARGTIAFDRTVCGHSLSIAPGFDFHGDLIDQVHDDVRAFEAEIDRASAGEYSQLAIQRSDTSSLVAKLQDNQLPDEHWLLVTSRNQSQPRWALVPATGTSWFTPQYVEPGLSKEETMAGFAFDNHVTRIKVTLTGGATRDIVPTWNHSKWTPPDPIHPELPHTPTVDELSGLPGDDLKEAERLYYVNLMMLESACPEGTVDDHQGTIDGFTIIDDPRFRLNTRDLWRQRDRLTLPQGVYPYTFRPRTAPDYEDAERRAARTRSAGAMGATTTDKCLRTRATLLGLVLQELESGPSYFDDNQFVPSATAFIQSGTADIAQVDITRSSGGVETTTTAVWSKADADIKDQILPLKICQQFNASPASDRASGDSVNGAVTVKLPVDLRGLFMDTDVPGEQKVQQNGLEFLDHFHVFRRIGTGDWTSVTGGEFIPPPAVVLPSESTLLLRPFLFSESFEVRDGEFTLAELNQVDTYIRYMIVPVLLGEPEPIASDIDSKKLGKQFDPVQLYVPARSTLPSNLSMACSAQQLVLNGSNEGFTFQLMTTGADGKGIAVTTSTLASQDFELWYEPVGIRKSGFFGKASDSTLDWSATNPGKASSNARQDRIADALDGERLYSTQRRKRVEDVEDVNDDFAPAEGVRRFPLTSLEITGSDDEMRLGYRFFIRAKGTQDMLQRLPTFLTGTTSNAGGAFQSVEQLEWFNPVTDLEANWLAQDSLDDAAAIEATPSDPRHRLRLGWHGVTPAQGGFLIELRDTDEDRVILRRRVEVVEDDLYSRIQADFHETSRWRLVTGGTSALQPAQPTSLSPREYYWDPLRWFRTKRTGCTVGAGSSLNFVALQRAIQPFDDWYALVIATWNFWTSVAQFLADAQNDYSKDMVTACEQLKTGLVMMMTGLWAPEPNSHPRKPQSDEKRFTTLEADYITRRADVLNADPNDRQGAPLRELRARDVAVAREIVAILDSRRQRAIDAIDGVQLALGMNPSLEDQVRASQLLAQGLSTNLGRENEQQMIRTLQQLEDKAHPTDTWTVILPNYPLCQWFIERLIDDLETKPSDLRDRVDGKQVGSMLLEPGRGELDRFVAAVSPDLAHVDDPRVQVVPYVIAIQEILAQAPSISDVDPQLPLAFVQRPHHSLRISRTKADDRLARSPEPDDLASFLPQYLLESLSNTRAGALRSPTLSMEFVHLLERLGFAVDVAIPLNDTEFAMQDTLVQAIEQAAAACSTCVGLDDYYCYVCRGRAPAEATGAVRVSFSFVKVILVPKLFIRQLEDSLPPDPPLPESNSIDSLSAWWQLRSLATSNWEKDKNKDQQYLVGTWLLESFQLLDQSSTLGLNRKFADVWAELLGGSAMIVPSVRDRVNIVLELPLCSGQNVLPNVLPLSRYQLVADQLQISLPEPQIPKSSIDPISFRPYYTSNFRPPQVVPIGYALSDRFYFVVPGRPLAAAAINNKLAAIRTGNRGLIQLQFLQSLIDHEGVLSLANILGAMQPASASLGDTDLLGGPQTFHDDVALHIFDNELVFPLLNLPYFNQYAVMAQEVYEARFESISPFPSDQVRFYRREPSWLGYRQARVLPPGPLKNGDFANDAQHWQRSPNVAVRSVPQGHTQFDAPAHGSFHLKQSLSIKEDRQSGGFQEHDRYLHSGGHMEAKVSVRLKNAPTHHGKIVLEVHLHGRVLSATTIVPDTHWQTIHVPFDLPRLLQAAPEIILRWHPGDPTEQLWLRQASVAEPGRVRIFLTQHLDNLLPKETAAGPLRLPIEATTYDLTGANPATFWSDSIPDMTYSYALFQGDLRGGQPLLPIGELQLPWCPGFQGKTSKPCFVVVDPNVKVEGSEALTVYFFDNLGERQFAVDFTVSRGGAPVSIDELLVVPRRNGVAVGSHKAAAPMNYPLRRLT